MTTRASDTAPVLIVRRTFMAPRERVFYAWINAGALEQWFRPMGVRVNVRELDVRVGGAFRFELAGDGGVMEGTYLEIVPTERLVFTWTSGGTQHEETLVTVEFVARGAETEVVLTHARLSGDEMLGLHRVGWQAALDGLAAALSAWGGGGE
jgi:uncharacterized protein YndB with AHSA1/START domain